MTHVALPPFAAYSGSLHPKMLLVGEAWGEGEDKIKKPFVGTSGKELWRILGETIPCAPEEHSRVMDLHKYDLAWVRERHDWLVEAGIGMTNLINLRPEGNKFALLCANKKQVTEELPGYDYPAIGSREGYLKPQYLPELFRLEEEIAQTQPNLIVCLGNKACWGVLRQTNIGSIRGAITRSHQLGNGSAYKVLPTYHPASLFYEGRWNIRPIIVADLTKAWREAQFPEIRRPFRQIIINPSLDEVRCWVKETLALDEFEFAGAALKLSCDVETSGGMIDTIGFGRARDSALVIPLGPHRQKIGTHYHCILPVRDGKPVVNYWSVEEEVEIWNLCEQLLESAIPKVGQNFIYDLQYILPMKIYPNMSGADDPMLRQHSVLPESPGGKSLGFLGSIFTSEPAWKLMRRKRADTEKRDE